MKRYIFLLWRLLAFKMNSKLIYRFDFWTAFFADGMLFVVQLLMFGTIFTMVDEINGWNFYQVVIFIGTFTIIDGLNMGTYFFGLSALPSLIQSGELDRYIIKPVNTLFLVSFDKLNPGSLFLVIFGFIIVGYGAITGNLALTFFNISMYFLSLIAMYILMYSLMALLRVMAFWVVKISGLENIEGNIIELGFRIPGSAFEGFFKILFLFVMPYALIATGPTMVLTSLGNPLIYGWIFGSSLLFFFLATTLFKKGLCNYSSASS